jgi:uncharacterized protein (TIGR02996 family)
VRRYEVSDGRSHKFWEVSLAGRCLKIRFGRTGSDGQRREKEFETDEEARAAHQRAIAEKLSGGYKLVFDDDLGTDGAAESSGPEARNPELEAAILAAPDDPRAYLVYGDWLQAQHDPRGELVALQHAMQGEKEPGRFLELRRAEQAIFKQHAGYLLGALLPELHRCKLEWRLGFIHSARLTFDGTEAAPEQLLELVLSIPSSRFLQELELAGTLGAAARDALWDRLAALPLLCGLRLTLRRPPLSVEQLAPLLEGRLAPGLRHLGLPGTDELCTALARTPLFRQLETLDLARGNASDAGAAVLAEACRTAGQLRLLDISYNALSIEGAALLESLPLKVRLGSQARPRPARAAAGEEEEEGEGEAEVAASEGPDDDARYDEVRE